MALLSARRSGALSRRGSHAPACWDPFAEFEDPAAARAGHQAVTAWIAELAGFLADHTSQLCAPDPALPGPTPPGG